jgi:hypothetical protein
LVGLARLAPFTIKKQNKKRRRKMAVNRCFHFSRETPTVKEAIAVTMGLESNFVTTDRGAEGFQNVVPKTRAQRRAVRDKESLEKNRLRGRFGGTYARATRTQDFPGAGHTHTTMDPRAQGFITEANRFITGGFEIAHEASSIRDKEINHRHSLHEQRREANAARDEQRWQRLDKLAADDDDRWERYRADGGKARRNKGSVPFDVIKLGYNNTYDGDCLRVNDQNMKRRSALRALHLQHRQNASGYNPVTGAAMLAWQPKSEQNFNPQRTTFPA